MIIVIYVIVLIGFLEGFLEIRGDIVIVEGSLGWRFVVLFSF